MKNYSLITNALEAPFQVKRRAFSGKGFMHAKAEGNGVIALKEATKKWTMPIQNWGIVLNQFMLIFEKRLRL